METWVQMYGIDASPPLAHEVDGLERVCTEVQPWSLGPAS